MFYINIGIQEPGHVAPRNMSHPAVPPFQLVGPNNLEYPGQFCLPQVGMPKNLDLQVGQNITIQVIELAQHGAALYNVSSDIPRVTDVRFSVSYTSADTVFLVRRRNTRRARGSRGGDQGQLLQQLHFQLQPRICHDFNRKWRSCITVNADRCFRTVRSGGSVDRRWLFGVRGLLVGCG